MTIPREFEQFIDTDLAAVRPHPDDDILDALVIPLGAILEQMPDSSARQRLLTQPNAPAREALTKLSGSAVEDIRIRPE